MFTRQTDPLRRPQVRIVKAPLASTSTTVRSGTTKAQLTVARNAVAELQFMQDCEAVKEWVQSRLGINIPENQDVIAFLKDGVALCQLMNAIVPGSCRYTKSEHGYHRMNNINSFLKACEAHGVPRSDLFDTADLYEEKNIQRVVKSLLGCSRNSKMDTSYINTTVSAPTARVAAPFSSSTTIRRVVPSQKASIQTRFTRTTSNVNSDENVAPSAAQPAVAASPPSKKQAVVATPPTKKTAAPHNDEDTVEAPSPLVVATVSVRPHHARKAHHVMLEQACIVGAPTTTVAEDVHLRTPERAKRAACCTGTDVLQGFELDAEVRKFLFNLYLEQPRFRSLLDSANLSKSGDDGQYVFRGAPIQLVAHRSGDVFVRRGGGLLPMAEWMEHRFLQNSSASSLPAPAAFAAPAPRQEKKLRRHKKKPLVHTQEAALSPRAKQGANFDELEHLRSLLGHAGNPLADLE